MSVVEWLAMRAVVAESVAQRHAIEGVSRTRRKPEGRGGEEQTAMEPAGKHSL
jgi:hypothetical protein